MTYEERVEANRRRSPFEGRYGYELDPVRGLGEPVLGHNGYTYVPKWPCGCQCQWRRTEGDAVGPVYCPEHRAQWFRVVPVLVCVQFYSHDVYRVAKSLADIPADYWTEGRLRVEQHHELDRPEIGHGWLAIERDGALRQLGAHWDSSD